MKPRGPLKDGKDIIICLWGEVKLGGCTGPLYTVFLAHRFTLPLASQDKKRGAGLLGCGDS